MFVGPVCEFSIWQHVTTGCILIAVPVICELSMLCLNQQQCVLSAINFTMSNSNNAKPLDKGQRDLGRPCRAEGASLFSSPNLPSTANLTLLKSWDFSTDNLLAESCCTMRERCTKSTKTPALKSRDSANLSSCPFSLRGNTLTTPVVQWLCLGTTILPTRFLQCKGLAGLHFPEWWHIVQPSTDGIESVLFVLEVQILSLVTTYDKCHSWRDNLVRFSSVHFYKTTG